jgi:D-beta-D-heptose 7-phosphate kinase/D-beta-D-heptose 1-phosphate adenosyltransferase
MDFSGIDILCVGDVMLDRFVEGEVARISPEAPVPVLDIRRRRTLLGGAGNVAANIASLGGRAILVGLRGADEEGELLENLIRRNAGLESRLLASPRRPTITKTRFLASRQQIVRADEESRAPLSPEEEERLIAACAAELSRVKAVILSDYGKGVASRGLSAWLAAAAAERGIPLFVDPKRDDFAHYHGAFCITPNFRELTQAARRAIAPDDEGAIAEAARELIARAGAAALLVTRSERGMMLITREGRIESVPAHAREVFDVSGAGDTVIATLALAYAASADLVEAMHLANAAAAVAVSKVGTATVTREELRREIDAAEGITPPRAPGLIGPAEARDLVDRWKREGLAVGFTNGCFDILHPGHVDLLAAARRACDRLIVALNSDASVRRLKGPERPVNTLAVRARLIAALRDVDAVTFFEDDTPEALIADLLPDVLVKGGDYTRETVVGADIVERHGGRVLIVPLVPGHSTTATLARLRVQPAGG